MLLSENFDPADDLVTLFEIFRCARSYPTGCECAQEIRMYLRRHRYPMVNVLDPDWYDETKFYIRVPMQRVVDDEVQVYGNIGHRYKRLIIRHGYHYDGNGMFEVRDGYPIRLVEGPKIKFDWGLLFEIPESDYLQLIKLANNGKG